MKIRLSITLAAFLASSMAVTLVHAGGDNDYSAAAKAMLKKDFHSKGQAKLDRLNEDGLQAICNRTDNKPPADIAKRLEHDQLADVKYPADGKLLGDWKAGEKIAKNGRGMSWKDPADKPAGGGCYNCHQLDPKQTSFGTIGPSLNQFAKKRGGFTPENQKYIYAKIYNAKAFSVCSGMPRFGHAGALDEKQIKDLVALIMDPASPLNKPD